MNLSPTAIVLGQTLALLGAAGGVLAGLWAGWRPAGAVRFRSAFLVYLGLVSVAASTWSGSMEIVPLTLALGALVGIVPFGLGFVLCRAALQRARAAWASPKAGSGGRDAAERSTPPPPPS